MAHNHEVAGSNPAPAPNFARPGEEFLCLTEQMTRFTDGVSRRRRERGKWRLPCNGAPVEDGLALPLDIAGTRGECVGYVRFKPVKWHVWADDVRGLPDLDDFIDVKAIVQPHHRLVVLKKANPEWAFLLVDGSAHPVWRLVGWLWGWEAQREEFLLSYRGGHQAYFVDPARVPFRPVAELEVVLRERQARRAG